MEFSEEQQRIIDGLINKRVAEVKSKADAKAAELLARRRRSTPKKNTLKADIEKTQRPRGGE